MKKIGTAIKNLRKKAGLSQRELAHDICTQAQISKIEKNNEIPSAFILYKIANRLGVDMNYFFEVNETPRIDYVNDTKDIIRELKRERNYKRIFEIVKSEKENPLFQKSKDKQFLYWHEAICIHYLENKPKEAIDLLKKALYLTYSNSKVYLIENEIEILNSIAIIQKDMKLYEEAEKNFKVGLNVLKFRPKPNSLLKVRLLYGLSKLITELGRYDESLRYSKDGIRICKKKETLYLLGELLYQCGENSAKLGRIQKAEFYFDKAIQVFDIQENHKFIKLVRQYRKEILNS